MIGPWTHTAPGLAAAGHRDGIAWLRAHLLDDDRLVRDSPVRRVRHRRARPAAAGATCRAGRRPGLANGGCGSTPDERLRDERSRRPARRAPRDRYRYDPADPTPSVGGPVLLAARARGRQPRARGARRRADVHAPSRSHQTSRRSGRCMSSCLRARELAYFDLFARVCDVDRRRRLAERVRRAGARRSRAASSRADDGAWASRSTSGRSHTGSPPATASACRSPRERTRATRATPGTGEDRATAHLDEARSSVELLHDSGHPSMLVLPAAAR